MGSLLKALTRNWKLKLLAFAMSLLLWVVVSADQITNQWINVPLRVELQDDDWELVDASVPAEVAVRFLGPARELFDVAMDRPRVVLRVARVDEAMQSFPLDPSMVQTTRVRNFSAQDVRPGQVRLRFARLAAREVPVRVQVGRPPRSAFVLAESIGAVPSRVVVRGAGDAIAGVTEVVTEPLDLAREDSAFQRRLRLIAPADGDVRLEVDAVTVSGRVERVVERAVEGVPVSAPAGLRAQPATASVRLSGGAAALAALRIEGLRAVAVLDSVPDSWPEEGLLARLRLEPAPAGVTAQLSPDTVRLFRPVEQEPDDAGPQP